MTRPASSTTTTPGAAKQASSPHLVKALAHPIRVNALRIMGERVASPSDVARELREPLNKVSHHVKVLCELDCIELVTTKRIRGATAHFYRAKTRPLVTDDITAQLPEDARCALSNMAFKSIVEEAAAAFVAGTVDRRTDKHFSWMYLDLDEEGWTELIALKAVQLEEETEIAARSLNRMVKSGEQPVRVFTAGMGFEAPPASPPQD